MNFKKFISSVSALAIAATAFVSFAVTASAENIYTQDYEAADATADWSTGTNGRFTPVILEDGGNHYLSVNQDQRNNNGTTLSSSSLSGKVAAGKDFAMTFDLKVSSSTNQSPASFTIYDAANSAAMLSLTATGTWAKTWIINGNPNDTVELTGSASGNADITTIPWYSYKLVRSGSNTYLTIKDAAGTAVIEDKLIVTLSEAGGLGKMNFATRRYNANLAMDNIVVRDIEDGDVPEVPVAEFGVKYVTDGGTELAKTASGTGAVGDAPALSADDTADFVENGQKYIYVSNDSADVSIAEDGSTVVTVTVREAASYAVSVAGSEGTALASANVFEGDSYSYSYPKYLTDENKKVTAETSATTYIASVTPTEATDIEIPYTAYEGTAYFADHEKITNTATLESGNYSGGTASRAVNDGIAAFTVAEAGTYDITVAASCRNTNNSSVFAVYKNEVSEANLIFNDDVKGASQNTVQTSGIKVKTDVELAANDVIIIQGDNGNTWVDYILAVKTGDVTVTPAYEETASEDVETFTTNAGAAAAKATVIVDASAVVIPNALKWIASFSDGNKSDIPAAYNTVASSGSISFGLVITDLPEGVSLTGASLAPAAAE